MDSVIRAAVIYFFLLIVFRASGNRTLAQITSFDFILLLIIGEATQQALLADDFSIINAMLVILTLIGLEVGFSMLKIRLPFLDTLFEGKPLVLVVDGKPLNDRMKKSRINEEDILTAARELQGLARMDQIQYAVLECSGGISIIPKDAAQRKRENSRVEK